MPVLRPTMIKSLLVAACLAAPMAMADPALKGGPQPADMIIEPDTYRFGYPYHSTRGESVEQCAALCTREARCSAWSLTPATFQIGPRCELKRKVGKAERQPGAVSGLAVRPYASAPPQPVSAPASETPQRQVLRPVDSGAYRPAQAQPAIIMPSPADMQPVTKPSPKAVPISTAKPMAVPAVDAMRRAQPKPQAPAVKPVKAAAPAPVSPPKAAPTVNAMTRATPKAIQQPLQVGVTTRKTPPPMPPQTPRKPWTERTADDIDYSVQGMDFIPGDREAAAGFLDGAPED